MQEEMIDDRQRDGGTDGIKCLFISLNVYILRQSLEFIITWCNMSHWDMDGMRVYVFQCKETWTPCTGNWGGRSGRSQTGSQELLLERRAVKEQIVLKLWCPVTSLQSSCLKTILLKSGQCRVNEERKPVRWAWRTKMSVGSRTRQDQWSTEKTIRSYKWMREGMFIN